MSCRPWVIAVPLVALSSASVATYNDASGPTLDFKLHTNLLERFREVGRPRIEFTPDADVLQVQARKLVVRE